MGSTQDYDRVGLVGRAFALLGLALIAVAITACLALVDEDTTYNRVDLEKTAEIRNEEQQSKSGWSPWHGESLTGWPVRTWVRGHLAYYEGAFNDQQLGSEAQFDHLRGGYWKTGS